jgi:tetratricopeptide (TPR) repeat protein
VFFLEINPYLLYNFIGLIKQGIIMNNIMKIIVLSSSFLCATEQGSELSFNLSDRQQIDNSRHSIEKQMREAISFHEKNQEKKLSDEQYNLFFRGSLKTAFKLMDTDLQNQVTLAYIHRYGLGKLTDTVSLDRRIVSTEATDPFSNKAKAQALIGLGNARDGRDQGVAHYREALKLTQDRELQAQAHIGLGNARDGDRVAHYKKALELTQDRELQAQTHIGLGNARDGGANNVAHYREALKLTQDRELQAQAHIGLGNARADNVQIPHYREALKLTKDPELHAQAHIGLGNAYAGNRDNVAALKEFINAFQIGGQATKKKVYEILEQKAVFIENDLEQYTGTDKQQLKNWW